MNNSELDQRLQRLEHRLNRYRLITASLGAALLGIIALGAAKDASDEIRTKKLVIVNDQGKEGAVLMAGGKGSALILYDDTGHPMIMAGCEEAGGRFRIMARNGQEYLHAAPGGSGGELTLVDKHGKKSSLGEPAK
jgi:hypothetical protein